MKSLFTSMFVFLFGMVLPVLACPNCKDAYKPGTSAAIIGESYSWSVLFMLIMPVLTIGIISARIVYATKKKNRNQFIA